MTYAEAAKIIITWVNDLDLDLSIFVILLVVPMAVKIALQFVILILKVADGVSTIEKKDYEDEMAIYDDKPIQQIESLPTTLSGISLNELMIDGEIPNEAFGGK